jgi:hypothetical protein
MIRCPLALALLSLTLSACSSSDRQQQVSRALTDGVLLPIYSAWLDAVQSSLVLLRRDGSLISKEQLAEQMNSIRHMAVASDGNVVTGQQYMGNARDNVPLLAVKRPGQPFQHFPVGRYAAPADEPVHRQRGDPQRAALAGPGRTARQPSIYLGSGQR